MKTQFEKNKAMQYSSVSELLEEVEELTVVRIISSRKATPLNKKKIEKVSELDEMLPEYDFTGQKGVRGKYSQAYRQGHTVKIHRSDGSVSTQYLTLEDGAVMLEPDLRAYLPTAESVNTALRALVSLIPTKAAKVKPGAKSGKARRVTEKKRFSPAQNIRDAKTEYKIRDAVGGDIGLGSRDMKVIYDKETDTLDVIFRKGAVAESDEVREGIVVDYDQNGKLVSIEVLNASEHVNEPETMVYQSKASKRSSLKPIKR